MSTVLCRWLFLLLFLTTWTSSNSKEIRVVCYYTNWSVYRPGTAKFSPQNINPYLCTHLVYAFGGFTKENTLKPFDKYQDIEKGGYAKFTGLKTYNKNLKTLLAIGGWNEGSSRFSPMVANPERRKELVKNAVKFLRQNHFDGLDLDWEYPSFRDGGKSRDRDNYAQLVQELREEFERESDKTGRTRLLLTMAVPAGIEYINKGYDIPKLTEYLDWMNILSYDYHSAFEPAVNHHAPLYSLEEASEYNYDTELNIDYTIKHYLKLGADPNKLVMGIPTYGRSYTLFNPDANEIGAPADGPGDMGDATRENGYLAYYEICENIKSQDWEVVQPNPDAMGPYAYKDNQWVGYDDDAIARKKAAYVAENGLGGIMFWSIDNDDFRGNCHGKPYPIIEAAKEALISAYGLTDDNLISPPTKPSKTKTRTRTSTSSKSSNNDNKDEVKRKNVTSGSTRRRNRVKTKSNENNSSRPKIRRKESRRSTEAPAYSSLELVTPSYTTPAPPPTPDQGGVFKCEDEGFYPHPKDCKKYFWCLSGPGELGIIAHQFTCPAGLYFNKAADSCDYTRNVLCNKKLSKSTTTTTTTTTEASTLKTSTARVPPRITAATSRTTIFRTTTTTEPYDDDYEYEDDEDDDDVEENKNAEEDPRVIKELLDLIKKAGGIEELEKQLKIHENGSASVSALDATTPSSISKSLVERVLGKTKNNIGRRKPGYTIFNKNSRGPQNKGLEKKEEKHDRSRPQYTTITRQRPQKSEVEIEDDEVDEVESPRTFTKKFPEYVNIRRGRVSSTTEEPEEKGQLDRNKILGENDNDPIGDDDDDDYDDEEEEKEGEIRRRKNTTPQYVNIRRQRPSTTEETSTSKYTILRRGSTTEADLEDASENSKSRRRGTTTSSSDEISSEGKRQGTTASSNTDLRSKYKILRRGSTTESTVKETTPSTVEDDAIQSKSRRRGSTTPSTKEISDVKTRGTIISSITTVLDDQNFTDSSTVRYSTPPQVTLTTHSSEDITTLQSDSENPITTEKLLLTTPESLSSLSTSSSLTEQPNISLNLSDKTADGTETTISEKQPPLLLEPRPFSLSTSSPTTSLKPVTESSTRITKVSESNYKLRVRQKIPNTQTDITSTTTLTTEKSTAFRTRAPSRFRQTTSNNLDHRTLKPTQNASVRSKKRFSTTTEAYADNYEEYDLNRTYRPSDFADLSSLTAVDFAAVKGLNRFSSSSRQRRPRPTTTTSATTTTTTKKPEEGLKTSSRTLPLARKLLDGASFGKSRRVIPTKKEPVLDDQINSSSDTTHRIRSFTRAPSRFSTEKPPSDTGRIRNRKIIRRFRPTSTSTTTEVSIDNDSKKLSQDSATEIENFVESASTNPLFTRRFTRFPSTTSDSTTKLLRLSSTLPPREDDEQNETSDDVSIEEGENIKLSESNIRENSNVNNDNVLTYDGKKVRRRVLKRIRSKVDGKNDDFVDDVNEEKTSTEPNIIIRTRKIIRKLQSTESSLPIISTTEATDVSTIGRRRKIIRRLRPTSAPSEIIPLSSDSPVPTTAKTLYIRGRPFIPHLTTEANVDTSTETLFGKKEYKTISRAPLFESATEDKEFAFEKNKFENLKPLFKSKYKTILRNTSPQPEGGTLKTPEDHSQRTIDRSKYKTINRGITSTKSPTTEVDIDDNSEEQEENEEITSQSILRNTSPQPEGDTLKTPEDHSERTIDRSKYKTINRGVTSTKSPTTEVDIDDNSEEQEEDEELTSQSILRNTSPQPEGGTSKTPEDHSQRSIVRSKYKTINRGTISTKLPTTEVDIDDNSEEQEENEEITSQSTPKYRIYQPSNSDDQNEGDLTTKSPKYRIFRPILTNKSTDDEANAKTRILRPSSEEGTNESVTDNIQNIQNEDDTPENVAEDYQVNDKTKNDQSIKMEDSDKENENKNEQNSTVDENIYSKDEPVKQENNNEANENKNKQNNNDNENVNENDQPIKEEINEEKDGSEELITTTEEVSTEETTVEPTTSEEPHTTIRYVNPILDRQKNRPVYRRPPKITTQNPLRTTPVNKPKYKTFSRTPTISHRLNLPSEKPVENKNEEIVRKFVPKSLSKSRYNRINKTEATVSTESILSVSTASEINNTDINITDRINSTEPTPLTTGSPLIVSTDTSTVTDNITGTEIYNIIESTTFDNLGSTEIVELTTLPLNNDGSTISSEMTFEVTSTPTDIINITTVNITDEINSTTESTTEQLNLNSLVLDLKNLMNDTILQENETVNNKTEVSETTTFVASSTISNEITEDTRSETTLNEFSSSTTNTDTSTTETTSAYYPKSTLQSLQNRPTYNVPKRFSDASTSVPKTLKRFSPRGRGYSATSSPKLLTSTSRFTTPSSSIRNKFTYKYSTTEKNQFLPNEQEREDEDVEDYEEKVPEEVEEAKEEESEEQIYLSSILSSTTARTRSKPRISNRPSGGYTFRKSTETPKATEDLSDINKEAVKNRNKNLFSKKRKMNTPYAGTPVATSSTTTEERTTEGITTIEEKITVENATETITVTTPTITELVTKPTTTQEFETTEYLTTLHHIFAETEPIVEKIAPTEETTTASLNDTTTTMSSKVEKLIEVNRIVEVHEMNKSDNFDKDTKVIDKVGVINRVTVVKVVDGNPNPEENEINETTSESTTTATTTKPEVTLNINGAYIIPEIAKVQEVKAPDITSERQDRKYEVYGDIKVVDYSKKESNDKPAIIDGASNINIITPRPFHSTEASTISLEALFQTDTPQKLNNINANLLKPSGDYELLETGNSRYVNIRILGQDNEKAEIADDTQIVPIKVLKQDDDYITMKAQVVEVTPKTHKQTIKIVPIQVEMSRRIIGPSDFNTKLEGDVPKSGRVTTPFLFRVGGRRKTSPALATTTTTSTPEPSSRPTKITRRKHPPHTIKPLLESQDSTTKSLKVTDNRYKFVSRKPNIRTSTPKTKTKTQEPPDQTKESSNQQSLEENFEDENETTELGDIALALHQIQQAPVPSKPRTTTKTPVRRVTSTRTPTRSRIKYSTTASTLPLTTKKFIVRKVKPQAFEKINPSISNTFRPLSEYHYYDDDQMSILGKIPEHSKVLLHSNGVIECLDQGNFPHPVSCKKFISCAKMENGKVLGWEYTCPKNLSFDPIGGICNWSAGLGCNEAGT